MKVLGTPHIIVPERNLLYNPKRFGAFVTNARKGSKSFKSPSAGFGRKFTFPKTYFFNDRHSQSHAHLEVFHEKLYG